MLWTRKLKLLFGPSLLQNPSHTIYFKVFRTSLCGATCLDHAATRMVCGLCHRPDTDHTLSTSGPQRCKYTTHREDCPSGFRTKCTDQVVQHNAKSDDFIDENLLQAIDNLHLQNNTAEQINPSRELMALSTNQLQWLGIQPDQLQQLAQLGVQFGQAAIKQDPQPSQDSAGLASPLTSVPPLPMSAPAMPKVTTPQMSSMLAAPASLPWGSLRTAPPEVSSTPSLHQTTTPLAGIEQLVRQHVAQNEQTLQDYAQQSQPSSYSGPLMPEIRQDPRAQQQVSKIMDLLKSVNPVFGQSAALPSNPPPPPMSTIGNSNPLSQLQQLLGIQAAATPAPPPQAPSLDHLYQQLLDQRPRQMSSAVPLHSQQNGLPEALLQALGVQPQNPSPQLAPTPSQDDQLRGLIASLSYRPPAPAPTPPPATVATNQIPTAVLQQLQQNPSLLNQVLMNPSLLQLLSPPQTQPAPAAPRHGLLQPPRDATPSQQPVQKPLAQNHLNQGMLNGRTQVRPTEYSKYCQVDYSAKVTTENSNLVMFVYGYINQILASLQGTISPMSTQELIGRLQHLLHLLELTATYSSNLDYCSYAWQRARNYNARIFSDLDHGILSWSSVSSKLDPTSMMQAIEAVPKPEKKKKDEEVKKVVKDDAPPCTKWNNCDAAGKCQYEVDNPGKKCMKPHICSFCFSKFGFTRTNHKEPACNKKKEQAEGSQPT